MCSCGCSVKKAEAPDKAKTEDYKSYVCQECNTFKNAPAAAPKPHCCGKTMQEMH